MTRKEVLQMLLDSAPEDWIVHDMGDGRAVSVYTHDPRLWIINDPAFDWQPNTDTAPWLPTPDAWQYILRVMYGLRLAFWVVVVSVDGGAGGGDGGMAGACLPCPRPTPGPGRQTVPTLSHKIVKVGVPDNGRLEEYLDRYRLEVEDDEDRDEDWPWDWENYARACEEVRRREYLKAWEEAQRLLAEADALMRRERDREFERKCQELAEAYARMCDEVDKEYARLREEEAQEQEGQEEPEERVGQEQGGPTPGFGM